MRKPILIVTALVSASALFFMNSCTESAAGKSESSAVLTKEERIQRGSYLVNSIGCDDCHSPKRIGAMGPEIIPELRLSGYTSDRPFAKVDTSVVQNGWTLFNMDLTSAVGPWGQSFAANLTPVETGLGNWKEEQFVKAMKKGKFKGLDNTRPLLPPMPWINYRNMSEEDLKSIFAYLQSLTPVKNIVPAPRPFNTLN